MPTWVTSVGNEWSGTVTTDYAKRLDELDKWCIAGVTRGDELDGLEEAISIARALLKERDELERDLQEMIAIDHGRLSLTYAT